MQLAVAFPGAYVPVAHGVQNATLPRLNVLGGVGERHSRLISYGSVLECFKSQTAPGLHGNSRVVSSGSTRWPVLAPLHVLLCCFALNVPGSQTVQFAWPPRLNAPARHGHCLAEPRMST